MLLRHREPIDLCEARRWFIGSDSWMSQPMKRPMFLVWALETSAASAGQVNVEMVVFVWRVQNERDLIAHQIFSHFEFLQKYLVSCVNPNPVVLSFRLLFHAEILTRLFFWAFPPRYLLNHPVPSLHSILLMLYSHIPIQYSSFTASSNPAAPIQPLAASLSKQRPPHV